MSDGVRVLVARVRRHVLESSGNACTDTNVLQHRIEDEDREYEKLCARMSELEEKKQSHAELTTKVNFGDAGSYFCQVPAVDEWSCRVQIE